MTDLGLSPPPAGGARPTLRQRSALLLGQAAALASRRLNGSGGTALPGLVAATIAPDVLKLLGGLRHGVVTVTGTNGKTTTAHLIAAAARAGGLEPLANHAGSNLERGLVSTLVDTAGPAGELPDAAHSVAVLEVDEAALPALLPRLRPRIAVFLNLFRDQLDRYGEVDSVAEGWRAALEADASGLTLVLNADDPSVAQLGGVARGDVLRFGVEDRGVALGAAEHAADARFCRCGSDFEYDAIFVGHVGHWRCPGCGDARVPPAVQARDVVLGGDGARFRLVTPAGDAEVALPVAGLYSVYNALAAAAGALALGLPLAAAVEALSEAGPAFGRQERLRVYDRDVRLWLAKNPAGLNEVMRALAACDGPLQLLWLLNDGIQDGRDVSWIYDADVELLGARRGEIEVIASGTRAHELALRLHLAGLDPRLVEAHGATAIDGALALVPAGGRLELIATYTAMLEVREMLAARAGARRYWENGS